MFLRRQLCHTIQRLHYTKRAVFKENFRDTLKIPDRVRTIKIHSFPFIQAIPAVSCSVHAFEEDCHSIFCEFTYISCAIGGNLSIIILTILKFVRQRKKDPEKILRPVK